MKTQTFVCWDEISKELYGSEKYTHILMKENPELAFKYLLIPPGTEVKTPEISKTSSEELPPWKR